MTEPTKIHGNTKKAADMSLARREISPQSHAVIMEGRLSLAEAKELGRSGAPQGTAQASGGQRTPTGRTGSDDRTIPDTPPHPVSRVSKDDTKQECWCGCEELTSPNRRWRPGHDQRAKGIIKRAVAAGKVDELSYRLREYGEERGLI